MTPSALSDPSIASLFAVMLPCRKDRAPGLPEGDLDGKRSGSTTAPAAIFRRREFIPRQICVRPDFPGFASRNKIAIARRPSLRSGRCRSRSAVQARSARRRVIAVKAAMGAASPRRGVTMATDRDHADFESPHTSSPIDHVLSELQLYGYRPFQDEPDPRPLPQANAISGAVADIFDALIATLHDTRLEPDLEDLLWSTVNLFHRAANRVQRELDANEDAQKCRRNRTARRSVPWN
jgi:hypothetical protein